MSEMILEYDGRSFTLPYGGLIPPPDSEELAGLTDSIKQYGVLHQIYRTADDVVISGSTRMLIAKSLGIPLKDLPIKEIDSADAEMLAIQLNTTGRKWPRERLVVLAHRLRRMGWSERRICAALGVSKGSVGRFLDEVDPDSGAPIGAPENVVGSDGKSYPASKPTPEPAPDDDDIPYESNERTDVQSVEPPATPEAVPTPPEPVVQTPEEIEKELKRKFDKHYTIAVQAASALGKYQAARRQWQEIFNITMGVDL